MTPRAIVTLLIGVLPGSPLKNWLFRRVGHDVHKSAVVGPGLFVSVDRLVVKSDARIGPFNVFRDLRAMTLSESAVLGQWNWISAARPLVAEGDTGTFEIGKHRAVTSRHYVDCSGGVSIGAFSTIAGVRSTVITHGIDWRTARQGVKAVRVGDFCLISSNVCLVPGAAVPNGSVVAMGEVFAKGSDTQQLWLSQRAAPVRGVSGAYFRRTVGFVSPESQEPPTVGGAA